MKKIFLFIFLIISFVCFPVKIYASNSVQARIGNQFFDTLEEAILNSTSTDTITITSDISLEQTLEIHKTVNINLNNHTIMASEKVFFIQGGSLNLSGNGTILETKPNYGAITLKGSDDPTKKDFSTVSVGSGVKLEGWSGIFINQHNKTGYGILVNMNGSINALDDINGSNGAGIYINGSIQHLNNAPIINLSDTAKITSTGTGIYAAGYATYNINGAYISGEQSGIGIKSGVFNILDGTIIGNGEDKTPTSGNNNGINASGVAIQIESNKNYAGNIELYIKNGLLSSRDSNVVYEYTTNNASTQVKEISITGGTFISDAKKPVFLLSDSFKNKHSKFISSGSYSSDPTEYLKAGYNATKNDKALFEVISSTMQVFGTKNKAVNSPLEILLIISLFIGLGIFIYFNRNKVIDYIKSLRKK